MLFPWIVLCLIGGDVDINTGTLYIIATPIGNLADISARMREVIRLVDCLYAEDTRHTGKLCQHLGIKTRLRSLHDHNESDRVEEIVARLQSGENLGIVSDAGTPLISDPGFRIVSACHNHAIRVSPVAGPSALITALSVCGLPTDRFCFFGFLPARSAARRSMLEEVSSNRSTSVFFESRHRIVDALKDVSEIVGETRQLCVARELTKAYETVLQGEAAVIHQRVMQDPESQKGEFVIVIKGENNTGATPLIGRKEKALLSSIAAEMAPKKAAALVAEYSGVSKKELYRWLVQEKSISGKT